MNLLERALQLATHVHVGRTSSSGEPFILHPLRVLFAVHPCEEARLVALLEDVVGHGSQYSVPMLAHWLPLHVAHALDAIQLRNGDIAGLIDRCKALPLARHVKELSLRIHLQHDYPVREHRSPAQQEAVKLVEFVLGKLYELPVDGFRPRYSPCR